MALTGSELNLLNAVKFKSGARKARTGLNTNLRLVAQKAISTAPGGQRFQIQNLGENELITNLKMYQESRNRDFTAFHNIVQGKYKTISRNQDGVNTNEFSVVRAFNEEQQRAGTATTVLKREVQPRK